MDASQIVTLVVAAGVIVGVVLFLRYVLTQPAPGSGQSLQRTAPAGTASSDPWDFVIAVTPRQQWLLGLGMMYSEVCARALVNRGRLESLAEMDHGHSPDHGPDSPQREMLREWWGVTDERSCLQAMADLASRGHRALWNQMASAMHAAGMLGASDAALRAWAPTLAAVVRDADVEQVYRRSVLVRDQGPALGAAGIAAWDFGRILKVGGPGVSAGYVTARAVWQALASVEPEVRRLFADWAQYARSWQVGRAFWDGGDRGDREGYGATLERLLRDPRSPWLQVPLQTAAAA